MKKIGLVSIVLGVVLSFNYPNANSQCSSKLVKGNWVSKTDKKFKLIIGDKFLIQSYKGFPNDTFTYQISTLYGTDVSGYKCYLLTKNKKEEYERHYEVMSSADEGLTLMDLDKGNFLTFKKGK